MLFRSASAAAAEKAQLQDAIARDSAILWAFILDSDSRWAKRLGVGFSGSLDGNLQDVRKRLLPHFGPTGGGQETRSSMQRRMPRDSQEGSMRNSPRRRERRFDTMGKSGIPRKPS